MEYLYSFMILGTICLIGEILYKMTKLTPGHITSLFVLIGVCLENFDIYDFLLKIAPGGASLPITNFGHALAHASLEGVQENGFFGLFSLLNSSSYIIVFTLVLSFIASFIFKPRP